MRIVPPASLAVVLVLTVVVVLTFACATNPVTGKRELSLMSEAQEVQIGKESDQQIRQEMGLYEAPGLQQYVNEIGQELARLSERPNLPWNFGVVDVAAVNAFALPGGYIYVTRGILPYLDSEAQLAGVIGHEIGHVTARHAAQQYTRSMGGNLGLAALGIFVPAARPATQIAGVGLGVLFLKYGRDDEMQADRLGVEYGAKAGWHPRGVSEMLATLGRLGESADSRGIPNWLSTHPQPADRVERIETLVDQAAARQANWRTARDQYLKQIDGVVFGDDPRQGIVRGSEFLHPELRIAVRFPSGWQVNNGRTQVAAKAPDADAYMLLSLVQKPQGANLADIAGADMSGAGFAQQAGGATTINGVPAYVGTYRGTIPDAGEVVVRAAHLSDGGRVYRFAGLAPPSLYPQAEPLFAPSLASFRRMNASEAIGLKPSRIAIHTAERGDTWARLAERSGGKAKPETLAIMNRRDPGEPPQPGERLKIVVGG